MLIPVLLLTVFAVWTLSMVVGYESVSSPTIIAGDILIISENIVIRDKLATTRPY